MNHEEKRQTASFQFTNKGQFYHTVNLAPLISTTMIIDRKILPQCDESKIFHYTRCIRPKRVTSWQGPSPRDCARAAELLSKKCRNGGELLAILCLI